MEVTTGAMGTLLPKLEELRKEKANRPGDVKYSDVKDIVDLECELKSMQTALAEMSDVPLDLDLEAEMWANDVRELSYAIEDSLDLCMRNRLPFRDFVYKTDGMVRKLKTPDRIANDLEQRKQRYYNEEVKGRLIREMYMSAAVKDKKVQYIRPTTTTTKVDPHLSAMYNKVSNLVGIDKPIEELVEMLSEGDYVSDKKLKTVSIVGSGGLGKTTLAKAVYDKLDNKFDCGCFVSVGQNPVVKKVLRDILRQLDKEMHFTAALTLSKRKLIDQIRKFLADERYLIVIDDIWDKRTWKSIKSALVDSNRGSRIITTTRMFEVAMEIDGAYRMKPLSDDNSKRLFYTRLCGGKVKSCDDQYAEVPNNFIRICGGVPLSIITLASLLVVKPRNEWSKVYNSIGSGHEGVGIQENTRNILSLSYYDMPSCLKTCLLHLSVFPEDYLIDKNMLIWKWIAEGFVDDREGIGLFKVGESYFNELVNRSMIRWIEPSSTMPVSGCRVHDMVLDLIRSLSGQLNFVTILDKEKHINAYSPSIRKGTEKHINASSPSIRNSVVRRLALHNSRVNHSLIRKEAENMRSFNAFMCPLGMMAPLIFLRREALRVLDLQECDFSEGRGGVLVLIPCLVQLRYLGLFRTHVAEFPEGIGYYFEFLQTLDVRYSGIQELPKSIGKLRKLMCLCASEETRMTAWIGMMTSLEELRVHHVDKSPNFAAALGNLTAMRVLDISFDVMSDSSHKDLVASLCNLKKIQTLRIKSHVEEKDRLRIWERFVPPSELRELFLCGLILPNLPRWMDSSSSRHLSQLSFCVDVLEARDMRILGKLPSLDLLFLFLFSEDNNHLQYNVVGSDEFHKLRFLRTNIEITCGDGALPMLEELECSASVGSEEEGVGLPPLLQTVTYRLKCKGCSGREVQDTEAALRHAAETHPNRPTLEIRRVNFETESSSSLVVTRAVEAPMSYSLGAMGPLLRKLDVLMSDDYPLTKQLKEGSELLRDELEEISVTLVQQSMADSCNQMAKFWMDEVRELSFDIDDLVDGMMRTHTDAYAKITTVRRHRIGRVKTCLLPSNPKPSTRTAKIAELRTLVREASDRHDRYLDGVTVVSTTPRSVFAQHGRAPGLHGEASSHLIGIHDLKTELIKWLTGEAEQQLKVVPVVGPAGVGKTTLAKQVYRELEGQFECSAFVRASRKPDMRRLLGEILSQVQRHRRPSGTSCCTVQDLIDDLNKHLQDKRYIIVIDDIWETTAWDIVKSALPEVNNGSRIITTAETEGMALKCCGYQSNNILKMDPLSSEKSRKFNILKMEPLSSEKSRKLFFNMVFGPGHPCPEQFKEDSDRIIEICAGLPLATICVAGLLASQPDNSELWRYVKECLCYHFSTSSTLEETLQKIVRLVYNSLPHYLKTCLMYLTMYPEGYTMWKANLVKLWIAEGFIYATEGKDTGEVAESYFYELVSKGMILPMEINYNDQVLSCTLHHVVLDLITHQSNEEKFITALDYSQTISGLHSKARRLSLHFSNTRYATTPAGLSPSRARSLAFFGILRCMPSIVGFKLVRVLVLEFCDHVGCESLDLARISILFQLRYLKISCDARVELPAQMRRLQYLETLDINATVSAVPLDIIHLPGLLHLSLADKANLPEGIGRIRSLRTLHYFDLGSSSEYNVLSLGELMNLQDLHLTYYTELSESDEHLKRNLVALTCSLGKLVNLKSVSLDPGAFGTKVCHGVWSRMPSPTAFFQKLELLPPICIFSRLPHWIGGLQELRILTVVVTELMMKDVDILTGLPDLRVLSLFVRQPTTESIVLRRGAFPALKYFKYTCGVLRLAFQEEALPKLQRLELGFNAHRGEQYDHLLAGIEHLPSLKEIGGIIGAAPGAEEQDRCAAESALAGAIQKHPTFPSYVIVKGAHWVEEEHGPQEKQHLIEAEARDVTAGGRSVVPTVVECPLLWGLMSVSGRRRKMEDAVVVPKFTSLPLCVTDSAGHHPVPFRLRAHFCGVYDGHGSTEVANYCQGRLHAALVEELSRIESVSVANLGPVELRRQWEKVFVDCFSRVDDEVLGNKASRGGGQGEVSTSDIATAAAAVQPVAPGHMGSTAVVAVICSSHVIVANCGDSRAVLCRGKQALPLSVDHTPNREDERARIEAVGGSRVFVVLPVSRSIGDRYLRPWIIPVPEVTVVPRAKDEECLVLASEGLWDVMSNEEACDAARKRILLWHKRNSKKSPSTSLALRSGGDSADPSAQAAAAHLVKLALHRGSKDGITVVVVDLKAQRKFNRTVQGVTEEVRQDCPS